MTWRRTLVTCYVLLVLSIGLGVRGWALLWGRGILSAVWTGRTAAYLIACATVQLLTWGLVVVLLQRYHRRTSEIPHKRLFGILVGLVLGNLLYDVTLMAVAVVHFIIGVLVLDSLSTGDTATRRNVARVRRNTL